MFQMGGSTECGDSGGGRGGCDDDDDEMTYSNFNTLLAVTAGSVPDGWWCRVW